MTDFNNNFWHMLTIFSVIILVGLVGIFLVIHFSEGLSSLTGEN